jgi:D-sedoheptulose 7-phosphate isomerase
VATAGCFDGLHPGHVALLQAASHLGDIVVVGINDDASVRAIKGESHPRLPLAARMEMLSALRCVDVVQPFSDLLPDAFIRRIRPHIYCKSDEYNLASLPEATTVQEVGGEVHLLPRLSDWSSSKLAAPARPPDDAHDAVLLQLLQASNVVRSLAYARSGAVLSLARELAEVIATGGRIYACGNGGSAADAQHFAAELVGRFARDRRPMPAMSLAADAAVLTALSNDFGYEQVFSRQVEGLLRPGDALILMTTSGRSPNLLAAAAAARSAGGRVIALTGDPAGPLGALADRVLSVPSDRTDLVQQGHRAALHAICARVEQELV